MLWCNICDPNECWFEPLLASLEKLRLEYQSEEEVDNV